MKGKKKQHGTMEDFGAWVSTCDNRMYSKYARCHVCGKTASDHVFSVLKTAKSERPVDKTLDFPVRGKKSLFAVDRAVRIRITRGYGSAGPLDRDNLLGACKAIRDQITEKILGLADDRESESLAWEYEQKPGAGVMVEIFERKTTKEK